MSDDEPLIDIEGFRAMMREAGIEEAADSTLAIYLAEAPPAFARLETAVTSGDMESAAAAAHALKSSSSNVWARPLVQVLDAVERAARAGDAARLPELVDRARPMCEAVLQRVRSER